MSACSFKGCKTSKRAYPHLHMFRFPVTDKERCMAWVKSAECPEKLAHLKPNQLASRGVCALHFKQPSFMNSLCKSLTRQAVPVAGFINQDLLIMLDKDKTQAEVDRLLIERDPQIREQSKQKFVSCDPEPVVSESSGSSSPPVNVERDPWDVVDDVLAADGNQDGGADRDEAKCGVDAERRGIDTTTDLVDALSKRLSGAPLTLFKMQILHNAEDKWATEEKELALIMYYKSAPLYKYMRDRQHFVLPSDADIQHWIDCTKHSSF